MRSRPFKARSNHSSPFADGSGLPQLLVIVSALGMMLPTFAHGASNLLCQNLFVSSPSNPPRHVTVQIREVVRKERGEKYFALYRVGDGTTWSSLYAPRIFDRQGNLLSGLTIMGQDLATVIGYHENDRGDLFAPVPETYNLRSARFNLFLQSRGIAPITAKWYEQLSATVVSYLEGWEDGAQPVAMGPNGPTNHTKHDIAFHYQSSLLPVEVSRLIQIEAAIGSTWLKFHNIEVSEGTIFTVGKMDTLSTSANFPEDHISKKKLALQWSEHLGLKISGTSHMSPFLTTELETELRTHLHESSPLQDFIKIVAHNEKFRPTETFVAWIREQHPEWDRPYAELGLSDVDQIHELYEKRAKELRQAAHDYLRDPAYLSPED